MSARGGKSFVNTTSVQAGTARTKDHCAALSPVTFGGDSEALRTAHMSSATSSASAQVEKTTPTRRSSACAVVNSNGRRSSPAVTASGARGWVKTKNRDYWRYEMERAWFSDAFCGTR